MKCCVTWQMMSSNINSEYTTICMQFYRGRPVVKVDERYMDVLTEHVWNLHFLFDKVRWRLPCISQFLLESWQIKGISNLEIC